MVAIMFALYKKSLERPAQELKILNPMRKQISVGNKRSSESQRHMCAVTNFEVTDF